MAHRDGNAVLTAGLGDADAAVRIESAKWYRDVRDQTDATPLFGLLGDTEARVRATAATSIGGLRGAGARATLEQLVVSDPSAEVRRNAAWALGRIGDLASRDALLDARDDASGLVRRAASAALAQLR
jgi:HEAT repeat protein